MLRRLVDVIIPCYNATDYAYQSVGSALAQTYRPINVVVIDDGSTDHVRHVLEAFKGRAGYYRQENRGLPAARNRGLEITSGEYVAFLDADDMILPEMVHQLVGFLEANPHVDACHSKTLIFNRVEVTRSFAEEWRPHTAWPNYLEPLSLICAVHLGSMVFRRRVFDRHGMFPTDMEHPGCEDWAFLARCVLDGMVIKYVPFVGSLYRQHPFSMSAQAASIVRREKGLMEYVAAMFDEAGVNDDRARHLLGLGVKAAAARCFASGDSRGYEELLGLSKRFSLPDWERAVEPFFCTPPSAPVPLLYLILASELIRTGRVLLAGVLFIKAGDPRPLFDLAVGHGLEPVLSTVFDAMAQLAHRFPLEAPSRPSNGRGNASWDGEPSDCELEQNRKVPPGPEEFHRLASRVVYHSSFLGHVRRYVGLWQRTRGRLAFATRDLVEARQMNPFFPPVHDDLRDLLELLTVNGCKVA